VRYSTRDASSVEICVVLCPVGCLHHCPQQRSGCFTSCGFFYSASWGNQGMDWIDENIVVQIGFARFCRGRKMFILGIRRAAAHLADEL